MKHVGVVLGLTLSTLVACHGDSSEPTPARAPNRAKMSAASKPTGPTVAEQTVGMVLAANRSHGATLGDLKFELPERPVAGRATKVELAFVPHGESASAAFELTPSEGLTMAADSAFVMNDVLPSSVYRKTVVVAAAAEGVYYLNAGLTFKTGDSVEVRNFSIPIIIGAAASR